jgi:hypothetical protein
LTLQLGDWTSFKARARELFAAIPPAVLAADPAESEMEAFRRALKISLAVAVFAAARRSPNGADPSSCRKMITVKVEVRIDLVRVAALLIALKALFG